MSKINLYEDQMEFFLKLRASLAKGYKSILGVASPAFGKTVMAAYITETAIQKDANATVWFMVHRKNLLRQTSKSFWKSHIEHGLITSGKRRSSLPIQIGTIGTIYSRLSTLKTPKIMFVDEAHLSRGKMFTEVILWARSHGCIVIGLTGTPIRLDGKALGDVFEDLIEARPTSWLIEQGRLSSYIAYTTPNQLDLSSVGRSSGDLNKDDLAEVMDKPAIIGDAVAHWKKHAEGMLTVAYCVNVKHSKHTAEAFNAEGIPAVHVDADTTEAELKAACEGLADGTYKILTCCELVIEGFDLSSQLDGRDITLECCILLRPTESLARFLQMVFRVLRKKDWPAVILDHAGCIRKHGLPCDEREWSLEGETPKERRAREEAKEVTSQTCGKCFNIFKPGPEKCPRCGADVEKKERKIQISDGELEAVDIESIRSERKMAKKEQGAARGLKELVELGVRRGLKQPSGWAVNLLCVRSGRKPTRQDYIDAKRIYNEVMNESRNKPTE